MLAPRPTPAIAVVDGGLEIGVNIATQSYRAGKGESPPVRWRSGRTYGGFIVIGDDSGSGPDMTVRPEVWYSERGAVYDTDSSTSTIELDYLEFPLLVGVGLPEMGPVAPHLLVGPAVAFSRRETVTARAEGWSGQSDIDRQVTPMDFSVVLGIEVTVWQRLRVGARYTMGLANILEREVGAWYAWNRTATFMIGHSF
jgi:hypothetical protein